MPNPTAKVDATVRELDKPEDLSIKRLIHRNRRNFYNGDALCAKQLLHFYTASYQKAFMRHTFHTRSLLRSTTLNLKQLVRPSTFAPQKPFTTDTFSVRCLVHCTPNNFYTRLSHETSNLHQKSFNYTRCILCTRRLSPNMKWYITHHTSSRSLLRSPFQRNLNQFDRRKFKVERNLRTLALSESDGQNYQPSDVSKDAPSPCLPSMRWSCNSQWSQ